MEERDAGFKRGRLGNDGEIHGFLNRRRTQYGPPGLAGGHHVLVVAENGKPWAANGPCGHMKHRRVSSPAILYMLGIINKSPWLP
jgi:hypothetical protein